MDGELERYFMQVTKEKFDEMSKRFDKIDEKLDTVVKFRWQIISGSLALSSLFSVVIAVATIYFLRAK